MPQASPTGIPTAHESRSNSPDPTIALPMPPPSPTGRGVSTKNRKLSALIPRMAMYERIRIRIPTPTNVHSAVSEVITALTERRNRSDLLSRFVVIFTELGVIATCLVLPSPRGRGNWRTQINNLRYAAPAVLRVTLQTINRAIAFTTN